ncbi:MAG: hypothetical protein V4503_09500 [Gemmatimonadota bacterium]
MPDDKKVIETSEVTTEVEQDNGLNSASKTTKQTTVKTERKVEKDDEPIVIIHHEG